jgi:hypothetical protein
MYLIDQDAKEYFDEFEGVHADFYCSKQIDVVDQKTGQTYKAFTYMLHDFNEDLLNEKNVLLDNYSSVNPYYPEYKKPNDTPDRLDQVLGVVKKNRK